MQMKTELDSKLSSMESRLSEMEEKISTKIITNINQKFDDLHTNLHELRSRLENQEKRLYYLEKSNIERNLIFFGVHENEKSYSDIQNTILQIINKEMKVPIQAFEIQSIKRFGKKGSKPRPVSVALTTLGMKIIILKNKKRLEGSGIYIDHEFPAPILEKRKTLKLQMKKEVEKGNTAYLKYDKLIIKEKSVDSTHKKRQLSLSPIQTTSSTASHLNKNTRLDHNTWKTTAKKLKPHKNTMHAYVKHNTEA